jgi:hypothetical protein
MTNKHSLMSTASEPQSVVSDAIRFSNMIVWSGLGAHELREGDGAYPGRGLLGNAKNCYSHEEARQWETRISPAPILI